MIDNKDIIIIGGETRNLFLSYYFYDFRFNRKMDAIDSIVR